jgi:nucleoside diphosphate kinase
MSDVPRAAPWGDRIYCMIAPDCLRRGLASAVIGRLASAGLEPAGWLLSPVTAQHIDQVSDAQGVGASGAYRYRALDALFGLGPALSLVLADTQVRSSAERYQMVKALKGDAVPSRAAPGTIRRDLGAINAVLSLLHTSDSPAASARECALLTGRTDPEDFPGAGELAQVISLLESSQPAESRGFRDVLAAVRGRVIARCWASLPVPARNLAADLTAKRHIGDPAGGAALAGYLAGPAWAGLGDFLGARFDGSPPHPDMSAVQRMLAAFDIGMDPWERVVLATSSYFRPGELELECMT